MKTMTALLSMLATASVAMASSTVSFEDQNLAANSYNNGGPTSNSSGFYSGGVHFDNDYNAAYGSWSGFATSTTTDTTTAGYGNQYSAFAGSGAAGSSTYAVGYDDSSISLTLPVATTVNSLAVTNTTYAALSMRDGDSFAKKFGGTTGNDQDYFKLTITGHDAAGASTGAVNFYLADYTFADNSKDYIVNSWTNVDLTSLGSAVKSLSFSLSSTDNGQYGMNTPAYFAIDNLNVNAVPEPAALAGLVLIGGGLLRRKRA